MSQAQVKRPESKSQVNGVWTDARVETLKKLWPEGKSAADIARTLGGGISRNAVIGKAGRLGLPPHSTAIRQANYKRSMVRRSGEPSKAPAPRPKLSIAGNGTVYEQAPVAEAPPPVKARVWAPLPGHEPIARDDAGSLHCKWPITVDSDELSFCCGANRVDGPYCTIHADLAKPKAGAKENVDQRLGIARAA